MTETYSTKEMLTEIRLDQREHNERAIRMEETLNAVLAQATKTNGRVTVSEAKIDGQQRELDNFKTITKTLTVMGAGAWALFTFIFK